MTVVLDGALKIQIQNKTQWTIVKSITTHIHVIKC